MPNVDQPAAEAAVEHEPAAVAEAPAGETAVVEAEAPADLSQAAETIEPQADESIVEKIRDEVEHVVDEVEQAVEHAEGAILKMIHPDGGSTEAYPTDGDGNSLVPAADVSLMASHGFEVVGTVQP